MKSHWSYDDTAAKVQRRHNRAKERRWRIEFRGGKVETIREKQLREAMSTYNLSRVAAERLLDLITEQ